MTASGCTIGDDAYDEGEVLVAFEDAASGTGPGDGFLYLAPTADPDVLAGDCVIVPAGGVADILSGTIELQRSR